MITKAAASDSAVDRVPGDSNSGIFRLSRNDLPALRAAASELKQAVFCVDLEKARNVPGFVRAFSRDLGFPEWFGGNLDALHDCLTDLSWHPAPGYIITLDGYEALRASPTSLAILNEVLASVVEVWRTKETPFRIFYIYDAVASSTPCGHPAQRA